MGKKQTDPPINSITALFQALKRVSLIIFYLYLTGFILSCGNSDTPLFGRRAKKQNVLKYDVNAPFTALNPAEVDGSGSTNVFPLLYSHLFVPDIKGNLESDLAIKWSYDPERFTWTIYLRKDVWFHNRQPVTSVDVKYSLETNLSNLRPSLFASIGLIFPLSETTICIQLKRNGPDFLYKIWDVPIIPHDAENKIDFYNQPVGSGPFKFKHREKERKVVLEANEEYFNGRPSLDQIVFYFQPDREKAWLRLLSGKTDIAQEISPKNFKMIQQYNNRFYFDHYMLRFYTILLFNTMDPLFSDVKVRLALSYGIDREDIINTILRGYGKIAVGPMGVDSPFHNPYVTPVPYAPKKCLKLLQEAGWTFDKNRRDLNKDGKPFEFTIFFFKESQVEKNVARYIQLCLNDIGIKVHLKPLPHVELLRRYFSNNEFQAVLTEFVGAYRNPEYLKQRWASTLHKQSQAGCFEHPEVTSLIHRALEEKNPQKQKDLLFELDALLVSLHPGAFLFHKTATDAMSKRFHLPFPFSLTTEGISRLRHASISEKDN